MFEDFEFEEKYNPWDVRSLEEFHFYCCPACPFKNVNKTDFINHAVSAHPESQSSIEFFNGNKENIKTEKDIENLESEVEEKFNPWKVKSLEEFCFYCCPECPSKYPSKTYFIIHAVTLHPHSKSFIEGFEDNKAVIKTETTSSETESTKLLENVPPKMDADFRVNPVNQIQSIPELPQIPVPCSITDAISANAQPMPLQIQIQSADGNIRHDCLKCSKSFSEKKHLKRHIQSIHENVRYKCDKCDKSFPQKASLDRHIQSVHENVRYNCDMCDKSFSQKGNLKTHIQAVHENVQYSCDRCDKSFSQRQTLYNHIGSVHKKV